MAGNKNVHVSRSCKTDEFYTQLSTIEDELKHYKQHFKGKVVFCNADDPAFSEDGVDHFGDGLGGYTSNFFRYFKLNFKELGLKKLIATHFDPNKPTYKLELTGDINNDSEITDLDVIKTPLKQNGDFRSPECIEILKESDVVVTNPPFSIFREYIAQLMEYKKDFLIIGNQNALSYREIFPLVKENKMWLGYNSGHFWFRVPDYYEEKQTDFKIDETGQKWRRMGNICWYTNLDIEKRHQDKILYKKYTPEEFPKYDNYDAIEVGRTDDIPVDYFDAMGVPLTFMSQFNPSQFEIIGQTHSGDTSPEVEALRTDPEHRHGGRINGKEKFARILIRRKQ